MTSASRVVAELAGAVRALLETEIGDATAPPESWAAPNSIEAAAALGTIQRTRHEQSGRKSLSCSRDRERNARALCVMPPNDPLQNRG